MMYGRYLGIWCCALLLVISSSKSQQNFTSNNEGKNNLTVPYPELDANSTTNYGDQTETLRYDLYENCIKNIQYDDTQYEYRICV